MSALNETPLIVCFGDSLTAGYQSPSPANPTGHATPYGEFLQTLLGSRARVVVSGISGEVTGEMVLRFRADVLSRRPRYVVILGGTNDLGYRAMPRDIMRNLIALYEQARAAQIIPVPVTVPSIRIPQTAESREAQAWLEEAVSQRRALNRLIQEYAELKDLPYADLFTATADRSLQLASEFSNDGIHFTTDGYRRFAMLLYEQVFSTLPVGGGRT